MPVLVLVVHQEEDVQNYTQQITALEERRQVVNAVLAEKQSEHREAEKEFKEMEGKMEARANSDIPLKVSLSMLRLVDFHTDFHHGCLCIKNQLSTYVCLLLD